MRTPANRPATSLALLATLALGCTHHVEPDLAWLPSAEGWSVKDVDENEPPTWVAYHRKDEALGVQEIRVTGLVDAPAEQVIEAVRHRMLDDAYEFEGFELEILTESDDVVETYSLASMPWPYKDREVYERLEFTSNPSTGAFQVDVQSYDPDNEVPKGVTRVAHVHNHLVVSPFEGQSVLTTDSVHDLGGSFPNSTTYKPIRNGVIDFLHDVRDLSANGLDDIP